MNHGLKSEEGLSSLPLGGIHPLGAPRVLQADRSSIDQPSQVIFGLVNQWSWPGHYGLVAGQIWPGPKIKLF